MQGYIRELLCLSAAEIVASQLHHHDKYADGDQQLHYTHGTPHLHTSFSIADVGALENVG